MQTEIAPGRESRPPQTFAVTLSSDPAVPGQVSEQLMGPKCSVFILSLALTDEVRHVLVLGGVRVVEELVVDLCSLESVILDADRVIDDVVCNGVFTCRENLRIQRYPSGAVRGRSPSGCGPHSLYPMLRSRSCRACMSVSPSIPRGGCPSMTPMMPRP